VAYTQETFIKRANEVHNNKYTYTKTIFNRVKDKITITCPTHGDFQQRASDHIAGNGCQECSGKKRYTQVSFIGKASKIHPDLIFTDSLFNGVNNKVKVICSKHGEFSIKGEYIIRGRGCPTCGNIKSGNNRTKPQEKFIKELKEIYGDLYDYSTIKYKNQYSKVKILCKEHGEFLQSPSNLIYAKSGCPICGNTRSGKKRKTSLGEFILRADEFHDSKYDYSLVDNFKNGSSEIKVICPKHGVFTTSPNKHLRYGCNKCGNEVTKTKLKEKGYHHWQLDSLQHPGRFEGKIATLYFVRIKRLGEEFLKVGYTERTTQERLKGIYFKDNVEIIYEITMDMYDVLSYEFKIQQKFKEFKFKPKEKFGGWGECFNISIKNKILKEMKKLNP
jgi:hypothetical protein